MMVEAYGFKTINVKCKHCNEITEDKVQKGVDVALANSVNKYYINSIKEHNELQYIVFLAGDGDFIHLASTFTKEYQKTFIVAGFQNNISHSLIGSSSSEFGPIYIDHFWDEFKIPGN